MAKLSNLKAASTHRVLLFGAPKSGKTKLAGDLASQYNLLWFDLENGHDTLFQLPMEQQEKINVISLPDTRYYPIAIETMLKVIKGGAVRICETHGKCSCAVCARTENVVFTDVNLNELPSDTIVVIDSLTQLTQSAISHITKGKPEDYKLDYDDWGNLGKLMDIFLSHIQQARYNVICISHETEVEMEDGKNKLVPTAGTRNFSRNTAKYFDEVIYCEVKNRKHIAASSTLYNGNILTGSRTGTVLEGTSAASLLPIFNKAGAFNSISKGVVTEQGESREIAERFNISQISVSPSSIVNTDTPAIKSANSLDALRAKMAARKTS